MADKETPALDRSLQQLCFGESITFVDDIVCSDGPVFLAMRRLFNKVDCKDLADLVMKLPVSAVVARFANAPQEAEKCSLERLFQECFYSGFPDIIEWIPPDVSESLPSWLTDTCSGVQEATTLTPSLRQKTPYNLASSLPRVLPDILMCPTCTYGLPSPVLPGETGDTATVQNAEITVENEFARRAILLWAKLGRKTRRTVKTGSPIGSEASDHKIVSSSVDVPWGFIVPGGRFREMYYWDSYWIVRGLLYSGMISTARGIILNFAELVRRFGFIPNGNRSYYLTRSQPPVFSMMLSAYYAFTGDLELIRDTYLYVQREYFYWMEGDSRQVHVTFEGRDLQLNRYLGHIAEPRTESWDTDETVVRTAAEKARQNGNHEFSAATRSCILQNIRAAAESGWDFSSRWVPDDVDAVTEGVMPALRSESFLPVDLNRRVPSPKCWKESTALAGNA
ncbi:hypothetical protein, conserved [Eimeria necatrix]|uniref:Trehalase n=1 Tax=Eimeria necatrix TaxID=51315 RepID=U6N4T9_9EIME|nr:hypothetical protein, conserved [Eimeria necatrix]CDJ68950.1 hypothetical protein, conserved [Eimeria necatrix]